MRETLKPVAELAAALDASGVSRGQLAGDLIRVAAWVVIREVGSSLEARNRFADACRLAFDKVAAGATPLGHPPDLRRDPRCPAHPEHLCVGIAQGNGLCVFVCAIDNGHPPPAPPASESR